MERDFMQTIAKYQGIVAQGESINAMIARLHKDGLTALEAVKIVKALYGLTLNEAQQRVLKHSAWAEEARHVVVLSDYFNKLWEKPLYAVWHEWYHLGVHKLPLLRAATDEAQQQEVEKRLKEVTSANEQNRQHLLHEIANCSEEILFILIAVLSKYIEPLLLPAIQTLHNIGSPDNELATPWLVDLASDIHLEVRKEALDTLKSMEVEVVTPFFLAVLLNEEAEGEDWSNTVENICHIVVEKKEWALACAPAVAHTLGQNKVRNGQLSDALLSVLEYVIPDCPYVIPTLCQIAWQENTEIASQKAWRLLTSFPEADLVPYRFHIEWLSSRFTGI